MAKFGAALERYLANMEKAEEAGLVAVGELGQSLMQSDPNIEDRIFDGRLHDSISYATSKEKSDVGGRAENGDHVPEPEKSGIVYIGTACPYAGIHNYGGIAGSFAYGKNGNPSSRSELEEKITRWAKERMGSDVSDAVVKKICDNIEKGEQLAYPFFEPSIVQIRSDAPKVFAESFTAYMRASGNSVNEDKV